MKPTALLITLSLMTLGLLAAAPAQADPVTCDQDGCEVRIEQHCINGEHREKDLGKDPVSAHVEWCQPELGDTSGQDGCENWSDDRSEQLPEPVAFSDDDCLIDAENRPPTCVGPWTHTFHAQAGPAEVTLHTCAPPGGFPQIA